jgi:hypothetical protein
LCLFASIAFSNLSGFLSFHQNFKSRLALTLDNDTSPLDAALESVMPGMHQRLMVVETATRQVQKDVKDGFFNVSARLTTEFQDIRNRENEADQKLAQYHIAMATRLGYTSTTNGPSHDVVPPRTTRTF